MRTRKIVSTFLLVAFLSSVDCLAQQFTYDDFNRLTRVDYEDGSALIYTYDDLGNRIGYEAVAVRVFLDIKVALAGPYESNTGLMGDALRRDGHLPDAEPYGSAGYPHQGIQGGGEEIDDPALVFADYGGNSIVDWVVVELRDKNDIANVLHTRAALLQRDGDVVDLDGNGLVGFFGVGQDQYYVAVRHRNHLAIATADPIMISSLMTTFPIFFTDGSTETYGNNAQVVMPDGTMAMVSGDANGDGQVNAVDLNAVWRSTNGQPFDYPSSTADMNLDGATNAVDANAHWRINNSKASNINY